MLPTEPYLEQKARWPASGRHILAHFDAESVVVYQAFRAAIADEAVALQRFGPSFGLGRMSWIKPNFLWMMFRSGWATKANQERVLAIRLRRPFFEAVLGSAVASSHDPRAWPSRQAWQEAVRSSEVRLQWDPDHEPSGNPVDRRAIQLGLRGTTLSTFASSAIVAIEDVTTLVESERVHAVAPYERLHTPRERVFRPSDPEAATRVGLDAWDGAD